MIISSFRPITQQNKNERELITIDELDDEWLICDTDRLEFRNGSLWEATQKRQTEDENKISYHGTSERKEI